MKIKELSLNKYTITLLYGLLLGTMGCIILSSLIDPIFRLNENQLLYLFSSMAQIIGSIFGLLLTAYVFFVDKFKETTQDNETYLDAAQSLLGQYFETLVIIAISCGLTVFICIFGIISLHNLSISYPYIINQSVLLFILSLISVLFFGSRLLDPNKLDKEIKKQVDEVNPHNADSTPGDFKEFLRYYNQLENLIVNFAFTIIYGKEAVLNERIPNKPQILQSLKVLSKCKVMTNELCNEINDLRKYRNGLVHGVEFSVTQKDCDRISSIYNAVNNAFVAFSNDQHNSQAWKDAINQIYNLTSSYYIE